MRTQENTQATFSTLRKLHNSQTGIDRVLTIRAFSTLRKLHNSQTALGVLQSLSGLVP